MSNVIAIDIGGTKTAIGVFDGEGRILARSVARTSSAAPDEAMLAAAARAARLEGAARAEAVGVALPAIVDERGAVTWAAPSVAGWDGCDIRALTEQAFGRQAAVMFDGYAATLGEATFGAGRGHRSLVTLIIGTGFGAGAWLDGRVLEGRVGVAGAVGWNRWPLDDGTLSEPAERIASGTGILAAARRLGTPGDYPDARAVFGRARHGDPAAAEAIRRATLVAGTVAGHVIDLLAPELVVWSGGVGSRADFSRQATRVAQRSCQPYASGRITFTRSRLGAESSLVGAAARALSIRKGETGP